MTLRAVSFVLSLALLAGCVPTPADNVPSSTPGTKAGEAATTDGAESSVPAGATLDGRAGSDEASKRKSPKSGTETPTSSEDPDPKSPPDVAGSEEKPGSDTPSELEEPAPGPKPTKLPPEIFKSDKLTPLNPENTVLLDVANKRLLLKTHVCLDRGMLEMLLCLKQTKEHESILTLDAKAFSVHTGLLALGAETGKPATYDPVFQPATGQKIDIFMHYVDTEGKLQRTAAGKWIRKSRFRYYEAEFETLPEGLEIDSDGNLRYDDMNKVIFWYGPMTRKQRDECLALCKDEKYQNAIKGFFDESQPKEMKADWLFVGSGFFDDGEVKRYLAEGGYVICVANFGQAMIDVSVSSSADGEETLVFEAWHERLPPLGSEVMVELVPRFEKTKGTAKANGKNASEEAAAKDSD
jgi:hypothetical protein